MDIPGNELTIAAYAPLQIHKVVGVAYGTYALGHLLALLGETLVLLASGCDLLLDLLQTGGRLWGAAWAAPLRHRVPPLGLLLRLLESLFSRYHRLVGSTLFGGHWDCNSLAQLMLHMEQVGRVMRPEMVGHIGKQARCFITGRLEHLAVEPCQGWRHQRMPRVLIPCGCRVLQHNVIALGVHPHQAQTARKRFIERHRHLFRRHLMSQTRAVFLTVR